MYYRLLAEKKLLYVLALKLNKGQLYGIIQNNKISDELINLNYYIRI